MSSAQPIVATIPASPRNLWPRTEGTNEISTALPTIPADNPKRNLTLAQRDNLPHIGLIDDTYTITVTGEETDGRFCVIDMHIPPGGGPPPHRHDFEETFILLEGEMEATFRGKKSIVRAGGTLNIPANAPHQFHNASTGPVRMLCICSPAGQEKFFIEVGVPVATRTTPPPKRDEKDQAAFIEKVKVLAPMYRTELLRFRNRKETNMSEKLAGKVAVITGGSSGIGLATAKRFVNEGAYVFITGRRKNELDAAVKEIGRNVTSVQGDVSKLADIDMLYAAVKEQKGKVDIVFANAGIGEFAPLSQTTEGHFDKQFNVNVKGLLFTVQKALPLLQPGGSIVLNASIVSTKGSPALSVYSATKAAVRSFRALGQWT